MELLKDDGGSATVEYAVVALVAAAFAGAALMIIKGDLVVGLLQGLIQRALSGI